jgi:DNA repair protein RadA/Sms
MARLNPVFVCSSCAGETLKWQGQCPLCGEWNSLEQRSGARPRPAPAASSVTLAASAQATAGGERLMSGEGELDRVLGGGLVPGSVILLGGEPGIGKSTLLLQVAAHVAASQAVIYASGEESVAQVTLRSRRLNLTAAGLSLVSETDLPAILALATERRAALLVIDSIQRAPCRSCASAPRNWCASPRPAAARW